MSFDYEQSVWGRGIASRAPSSPTSIRLRQAEAMLAVLQSGANVLEAGSGVGQFIRAIKRDRPDLECYGTDISVKAIEAARTAHDGVSYQVSSAENFPFHDNFFDAVLIFDVLEHVESPPAFLQEVRRVLKPGGLCYAFVPCEGDSLSLWNMLDRLGLKKDLTKNHAGHIQFFSRASLKNIVTKAGFRIEKIRYSEHGLGQLIGVLSFYSTHRMAQKKDGGQLNNEEYFNHSALQQSGAVKAVKKFINSLVFGESFLLESIPSPNVHLTLRKT